MSDLKTQQSDASVNEYIAGLQIASRREDCLKMIELMDKIWDQPAKIWGKSIIGFGAYHYTYSSGRSGSWFITGFAPRKQYFTIYIMPGFVPFEKELSSLGKFKLGKSCLYVKSLQDIDLSILEQIIRRSITIMNERYNHG